MAIGYDIPDGTVYDMMREIIEAHHEQLKRAGVKIAVLMALNDKGPAIVLRGLECAGTMTRLNSKMRALTKRDALMLLDGNRFYEWPERTQKALIDHELSHLAVQWQAKDVPKVDSYGNVQLTLRLHDWEVHGFKAVAERWGDDAFEVLNARKFRKDFGPSLFDVDAAVKRLEDAGVSSITHTASDGKKTDLRLAGGEE